MLEESAIEELRRTQQQKKDEKEAKKKAAEEEKKRQEREAAKQALATSDTSVTLMKIETLIGQSNVFTHDACIAVQDVLRSRLMEKKKLIDIDGRFECQKPAEDFKFSAQVIGMLK
jgi:hypothetical protein